MGSSSSSCEWGMSLTKSPTWWPRDCNHSVARAAIAVASGRSGWTTKATATIDRYSPRLESGEAATAASRTAGRTVDKSNGFARAASFVVAPVCGSALDLVFVLADGLSAQATTKHAPPRHAA